MNVQENSESYISKYLPYLLIAVPVAILLYYPKPIFFIFKPFIKQFRKSYSKVRPSLTKIIFSVDQTITPKTIAQAKFFKGREGNIMTINLFDSRMYKSDSSSQNSEDEEIVRKKRKNSGEGNGRMIDLWADNTLLKIKMIGLEASQANHENIAVLVKGKSDLLRRVEAKIFNLKANEFFKIPDFTDIHEIHILEKNFNRLSYEHIIERIPEKFFAECFPDE